MRFCEGLGEPVAELARHYKAAGKIERAISHGLIAGKRALELSTHHQAARHLLQGLDLLESLPES